MSIMLSSFLSRRPTDLLRASALMLGLAAGTASAQGLGPQGLGPMPDTGAAAQASAPALTSNTQAPELPQLGEGILASVNDDMITSYDLKQRMLLLIVTSGVDVNQNNYQAFQQQALNNLIDERLKQQELKHWKVTVSDKEIDAEIDRMAQQSNLTAPQLLGELKKVGIEPQTLRSQIAADMGWNELVGGRYHSAAQVGNAQINAMMDRVIADGQKPQYLIADIFLDPQSAGGMEAAQNGAQQLYTQLQAKTAPFQAVARQFSRLPSAAQGGDEGWVVSGNIQPEVEAQLKVMNPGDISPPITTKDGVYIVMLRQKSNGNADMAFRLKQAAIPLSAGASAAEVASAQSTLEGLRTRVRSCDALDEAKPAGIQITNLGEADLSVLQPAYASALRPLKENQSTAPMRNAQNVNVLYVCDRRLAGDNAVTRDDLESNLVNERVSMLGKRYLRELRATATIENH
ncbi:MAG TPA: peptidylprolyl isomerase [Asticcacaulis sp.]|nr:peptidylprolyl isomerase [Asticcacaulis sp.]